MQRVQHGFHGGGDGGGVALDPVQQRVHLVGECARTHTRLSASALPPAPPPPTHNPSAPLPPVMLPSMAPTQTTNDARV
jgi:hypothetical protein